MKKKIVDVIIAVELLVMVVVPLLTFNWTQGVNSVSENRTLKAFPTLFDEQGELRDDLTEQFNDWFNDNIGLRDRLIDLSSIISFNVFHKSTSEKVEIGKEGWLYYCVENNLDIVKDTYPNFSESDMQIYCEQLINVQKKLESQGRKFVFVIPPSKVSIYPEYIQSGDFSIMETPADKFADYLEEHSTIKVVRLKDALLQEKTESPDLLYFKTDTHWNLKGRYVGYRKIIEDMNAWNLISSKPLEAEFYKDGPYSGDLAGMMGVVNFAGEKYSEAQFDNIRLLNSQAELVTSGKRYEKYETLMESEGIANGGSMWLNENEAEAPRVLVYGDSMIGTCNIGYIAENFSETTFVWSYALNQEMIDYIDPDIVVLDISERGLNQYLPNLFDSFLKTKFLMDETSGTLDIFYEDDGMYSKMYFPTWSSLNDQDDLVWYEAERTDSTTWHVRVKLEDHGMGRYQIHFYDGNGNFVGSTSYYVGTSLE